MLRLRQGIFVALVLAAAGCAKDEFAAPQVGGVGEAAAPPTSGPPPAFGPRSVPPPRFEQDARSELRVLPGPAPDAPPLIEVFAWTRDGRTIPALKYDVYWQTDEGPSLTSGQLGAEGWGQSAFPSSALIHRVFIHPTGYSTSLMVQVGQYLQPGKVLRVDGLILPAAIVSGVIRDENGEPLAGATVAGFQRSIFDVDESERPSADCAGPAADDGSFRLGGFSPGVFVLEAAATGRINTWRAVGVLEEGQELTGIELQMEPSHTVHGQVLSEDDEPVSGARIVAGKPGRRQLTRPGPAPELLYVPARQNVARSDERGIFQLPAVPDTQEWAINVDHPRFRRHLGRLEAGQVDVIVRLERGLEVRGFVFGADGERLPSAAVVLLGGELVSDAVTGRQGNFMLAGLDERSGRYLYVAHTTHAPQLLGPVDLGAAAPIEIRMTAVTQLGGRVIDAQGRPVSGARIVLRPERLPEGFPPEHYPADLASRQSGLTGADGAFLFDGIAAGSYRAEVVASDGRRQDFAGLSDGAVELELKLTAGP